MKRMKVKGQKVFFVSSVGISAGEPWNKKSREDNEEFIVLNLKFSDAKMFHGRSLIVKLLGRMPFVSFKLISALAEGIKIDQFAYCAFSIPLRKRTQQSKLDHVAQRVGILKLTWWLQIRFFLPVFKHF